jgi:L-amino acid N-acyltransferase YncA
MSSSPSDSPPAPIRIREAQATDVRAIATIYNEGIRGRCATFETSERSPEDVQSWLLNAARIRRPFLVAERP